jgi:hypothetical protein
MRHRRFGSRLRLALPAAALAIALALALSAAAQALAADAPESLDEIVTMIAQQKVGTPVSARYVVTTAEAAAALLGKSRDQLFAGTPDRVYLVVLHGSFSMQDGGQGSGPNLAFLYWPGGGTWQATDFTVLQDPVPLRSLGTPQAIEPFALVHPTLNRVWEGAQAFLFWFLPPLLLVVSAVLCAWKRRSGWPSVLAACAAVAVAAWQSYLTAHSMAGRSWDPLFHGIKLGILAVAVIVDLTAAVVLLRARSRLDGAGEAQAGRSAWLRGGLLLLIAAAAISVASLPWLGTTGE